MTWQRQAVRLLTANVRCHSYTRTERKAPKHRYSCYLFSSSSLFSSVNINQLHQAINCVLLPGLYKKKVTFPAPTINTNRLFCSVYANCFHFISFVIIFSRQSYILQPFTVQLVRDARCVTAQFVSNTICVTVQLISNKTCYSTAC
jgi:hypothetical protein